MPKDYFAVERCTDLSSLSIGVKIHIIGVCGVAMAQLAIELATRGYLVSGSDKEFYEPMGELLRRSPVTCHQGFKAQHIPTDVGLVVIGNAVSYENEEVQEIERLGYHYSLFPKILHDLLISNRQSIVVAGTHGKSTTTAMLAWLLTRLNLEPAYFIGAAIKELPNSLMVGSGKYCVVEGDEYDSAFFAKVPKFSFYQPNTLVITAIEFDHADIYPNLGAIEKEFSKLVMSLPDDGDLICCIDCENIRRLLPEWRNTAHCSIRTYGCSDEADFQLVSREVKGQAQHITVELVNGSEYSFELALPGEHNALNAIAAVFVGIVNDLDVETLCNIFNGFHGARRRQEVRFDSGGIVLVDDFAHHPTAVRETISAMRSFYPDKRLWAVFEPRSNTSRRKIFQESYVTAFQGADRVILCDVTARSIDKSSDLIQVSTLAESIGMAGTPAVMLPNADRIAEYLLSHVEGRDLILIMSNGGFGGLVEKLEEGLRKRV